MARIGFIGCGQMAQALASGFVNAGCVDAGALIGSDVSEAMRRAFTEHTRATATASNVEVVQNADVVFLAVKPQAMAAVLDELKTHFSHKHLVVSIAAGVTVGRILAVIGPDRRVVRVMPNTPCLVGAAACGYAVGGQAAEEDAKLVQALLESVGLAFRLDEKLLDAVTGLSGSGPAYVYQVIEALSDGGVKVGLPRGVATALAAQTVLGAAKMVLETGKHPGELKDMVTSPAGTTIAGLAELEQRGVRGAFLAAVETATRRSQELGGQ